MIAVNTMYKKQKEKLATYMEVGTRIGREIQRGTHEQIDFILINRRYRNMVTNAESDSKANIESDHYPVWAEAGLLLKREAKAEEKEARKRMKVMTKEEKEEWNKKLKQRLGIEGAEKAEEGKEDNREIDIERRMEWVLVNNIWRKRGEGETERGNIREIRIEGKNMKTKDLLNKLRDSGKELPAEDIRKRGEAFSDKTKQLLDDRKEAVDKGDSVAFEIISKDFRKSKQNDRRDEIIESVGRDLDERDRWMGIKSLRGNYSPQPYHMKGKHGEHIHWKQRAQEAANYLRDTQWGKEAQWIEGERDKRTIVSKNKEMYNRGLMTLEEIKETVRKLKRGKVRGPDGIPMDVFKEMDEDGLRVILDTLNEWWEEENMEEEMLRARIILIFKKGDTSKLQLFENRQQLQVIVAGHSSYQ